MRRPPPRNFIRQRAKRVSSQVFKQILLAASFLVFITFAVHAEKLPIRTYTTADGLSHNIINKIVRDSRGFLWFCTFEGLSRFDGYSFTNYGVDDGLPSPVINDLLETRSGEYWVATDSGVCRFNPKGIPPRHPANISLENKDSNSKAQSGPMFTVFSPSGDEKAKAIDVLFQDRAGTIWCGTRRGLYRLEERRLTAELSGCPAATHNAKETAQL
jgi:ligand-binding sensor domain-containing protein